MKRVLPVLLVVLLLCGCGEAAKSWQEEYDLGVRYLSEGNYDEAILAFEAAIEIDPKRAEAYLSLADVYVAQGDLDAAREVLDRAVEAVGENEEVLAKIEEITAAGDPNAGGQTEPDGSARAVARTERKDYEDGSYSIYEYDANDLLLTYTYYEADGTVIERTEHTYDANGNRVMSTDYDGSGVVTGWTESEYDANGNCSVQTGYDANGAMEWRTEYTREASGRITRTTNYDDSGNLDNWCDWAYDTAGVLRTLSYYHSNGTPQRTSELDAQGNLVREIYYKSDGTVDFIAVINPDGSTTMERPGS